MVGVKQVVKREAYEPKFGMKGVEHATPHARVEQTANLSEQSGCLRLGHIVQIPRYDDRRVRFGHTSGHDYQFCVAF